MALKAIKAPKDALHAAGIERAIKNSLNAVAKGAKIDFQVTSRTWTNKPEFTIETPDPARRIVGTSDKVYGFVDKGTRPHIIVPRRGGKGRLTWIGTAYKAKTKPGYIGSKNSSNNNTIVYTKLVQHPGTEARKFTLTIRDKWAKEMKIRMQSAILAATKTWNISGGG